MTGGRRVNIHDPPSPSAPRTRPHGVRAAPGPRLLASQDKRLITCNGAWPWGDSWERR